MKGDVLGKPSGLLEQFGNYFLGFAGEASNVLGASSASFVFEALEGLGLEMEVARLGWKGQDLKFRRLPVPALPKQVQTLPF